jgi:integrase
VAVRRVPPDPSKPLVGYQVRWRDPHGVQRKKVFPGQQKRAADAFFAETKTALHRGAYVDISSKITVAEYARQWVEIQPYRPSSLERRESQIRTHLEPHRLGQMRLVAVRPSDVQAFATEKDRTRAPETVRSLMRFVAAVFSAAVRDRLISMSPASRIALAPAEHHPVVPLTPAQVAELGEAVPHRMKALVITQVGLGLRVGELLALRLSDVDFLHREVHITEQIHPRTRERMPLKTPSARRTLPLPDVVGAALATHLAVYPANDEGYIFQNAEGLPYQAHTYQQMLSYRAKRVGLPHTTSHDLRHTYASWLLAAGESVVTVAARLGHRNANMVIQTYAHIMPNSEDRTRRAIDATFKSALHEPLADESAL